MLSLTTGKLVEPPANWNLNNFPLVTPFQSLTTCISNLRYLKAFFVSLIQDNRAQLYSKTWRIISKEKRISSASQRLKPKKYTGTMFQEKGSAQSILSCSLLSTGFAGFILHHWCAKSFYTCIKCKKFMLFMNCPFYIEVV